MTENQIKIAVAESQGWRQVKSKHPDFEWVWQRNSEHHYALPDYPNDLNAVHEVEKTIPKVSRQTYFGYISEFRNPDECYDWEVGTATARQRAEAYLRTIGKWID